MENKAYIQKKQHEELGFLWRHMEPDEQVKWLRDLRFEVKHRTLGRLYVQLKKFIYIMVG
jgi:Mg/Co/Ni transporter MgtE